MAGQWPLKPLIGVRIPVPEPNFMLFNSFFRQIKNKLKNFSDDFGLDLLGQKIEYPVIKIFSKNSDRSADLVLAAAVHGEEPAGALALFANLGPILNLVRERRIKIIIYPAVNYFGFMRGECFNAEGLSCNEHWIHESGRLARESRLIKNDLKKYQFNYFLSLHEQTETKDKKFYLYSFGEPQAAKRLVKVASKQMPIMNTGFPGRFGEDKIRNGIITDFHDGTFEDYMFHQGARASVCTETPLKSPLKLRILTNYFLIREMIAVASSKN